MVEFDLKTNIVDGETVIPDPWLYLVELPFTSCKYGVMEISFEGIVDNVNENVGSDKVPVVYNEEELYIIADADVKVIVLQQEVVTGKR